MATPNAPSTTVDDLRKNAELWYKIHVLIYDLRNFNEVDVSRRRLDTVADASYMGLPYFTTGEAQTLKSTMVDTSKPVHPGVKNTKPQENSPDLKRLDQLIEETLNERLMKRIKKREESGDFRVCAAHDLAPILEKALDISPKELSKDKTFLELMNKYGLELGDGVEWRGVLKKGGGPGGKKKGKR